MSDPVIARQRFFKTAWFAKAAKKARIADSELCLAITQVILGQADDLGGGVFKKRLGKNLFRSVIVTKAGEFWVFEFLFAKKNRSNIDDAELVEFRNIARHYGRLAPQQIAQLIHDKYWMEICNESQH